MKPQHFVYAIHCGTYDEHGTPYIQFGRSNTKSFAGRLNAYRTASPQEPEVLLVILCESKPLSLVLEKHILELTAEWAPPERPDSEVRLCSMSVIQLILKWKTDSPTTRTMRCLTNDELHDFVDDCRERHRAYQAGYIKDYELSDEFKKRQQWDLQRYQRNQRAPNADQTTFL